MDYTKLHWHSDCVSHDIYGEGVEEFTIGVYSIVDFPEIKLHVSTETGRIIDVHLDDGE